MAGNAEGPKRLDILPARQPLEYPLNPGLVCEIVGISKSTLYRWEREGKLRPVGRDLSDARNSRAFGPNELTTLLLVMKPMTFTAPMGQEPPLQFPWLQSFDPAKPTTLVTPSGYTIEYEPRQTTGEII